MGVTAYKVIIDGVTYKGRIEYDVIKLYQVTTDEWYEILKLYERVAPVVIQGLGPYYIIEITTKIKSTVDGMDVEIKYQEIQWR